MVNGRVRLTKNKIVLRDFPVPDLFRQRVLSVVYVSI
jgi:hypothetical protein